MLKSINFDTGYEISTASTADNCLTAKIFIQGRNLNCFNCRQLPYLLLTVEFFNCFNCRRQLFKFLNFDIGYEFSTASTADNCPTAKIFTQGWIFNCRQLPTTAHFWNFLHRVRYFNCQQLPTTADNCPKTKFFRQGMNVNCSNCQKMPICWILTDGPKPQLL